MVHRLKVGEAEVKVEEVWGRERGKHIVQHMLT